MKYLAFIAAMAMPGCTITPEIVGDTITATVGPVTGAVTEAGIDAALTEFCAKDPDGAGGSSFWDNLLAEYRRTQCPNASGLVLTPIGNLFEACFATQWDVENNGDLFIVWEGAGCREALASPVDEIIDPQGGQWVVTGE